MLNTALLLSSGSTVTYSHHSHINGKREGMLWGLIATVLLALIFTSFQGVEYSVSSFTISDGIFGSSFFFGTGYPNMFFQSRSSHTQVRRTPYVSLRSAINNYYSSVFFLNILIIFLSFGGALDDTLFAINKITINIPPKISLRRSQCEFLWWNLDKGFSAEPSGTFFIKIKKSNLCSSGARQKLAYLLKIYFYSLSTFSILTPLCGQYGKFHFVYESSFFKHIFMAWGPLVKGPVRSVGTIKMKINEGRNYFTPHIFRSISERGHFYVPRAGVILFNNSLTLGSAQNFKRLYSKISNVTEPKLSPYWVTGFSDGESCFTLKVSKKSGAVIGWGVKPEFKIELHSRDELLLRKIQSYFGTGIISQRESRNMVVYSVQSARDIANVIIPHFDRYPLITQKRADYLLFKQAINLILNGQARSSIEGFCEILSIKSSMNKGLSYKLKINFPTVLAKPRPIVSFQEILEPNWLAGFVDGEGCFYVKLTKSKTCLSRYQVLISLQISQHVRDELLLTKFIEYLGCGIIEKVTTRPNSITFIVYKFRDIFEKIIPFFQRYPLQGIKYMDYKDFHEVAKIMNNKFHLTDEGIKRIKSLKSGINTGRILN